MTLTIAANGSGGVRGTPKLVWAALIASLAVNLLVAGTIASFWWRGPGHFAGPGINQNVLGFVRTLPQARRAELRKDVEGKRGEIRSQIQAMRQSRRAAVEAISQEPFDAKAVEAMLNNLDDREVALRRFNRPLILDILVRLTPEERKAVVRGLNQAGRPGGRGPDREIEGRK